MVLGFSNQAGQVLPHGHPLQYLQASQVLRVGQAVLVDSLDVASHNLKARAVFNNSPKNFLNVSFIIAFEMNRNQQHRWELRLERPLRNDLFRSGGPWK